MVFGTVQDTHQKTKMEKVCVGFWDVWIEKYGIMGFWPKAPPKQKKNVHFSQEKNKRTKLTQGWPM